jgi:hypothetical protein
VETFQTINHLQKVPSLFLLLISTHSTALTNSLTISGIPLFLFVAKDELAINVQVRCDNMELAADIVQDISKFFKISELESSVNFPQEMEAFEEVTPLPYLVLTLSLPSGLFSALVLSAKVLKRVAEYNSLRVRMSADMADDSQRVKVISFLPFPSFPLV